MGMSGLLALCVHLFSFAEVERAGCRLAPARPLLKDDNQLAGFHPVDPFNENVINSARPPMLSTGTGPPSPSSSRLTRLSARSEEHTSELQSLMRISYAVFCLKKKNNKQQHT